MNYPGWYKYYLRNMIHSPTRFCHVHAFCYLRNRQYRLFRSCKSTVPFLAFYFETNHRCKALLSCSNICLYLVSFLGKNRLSIAPNSNISFFLDHEAFPRTPIPRNRPRWASVSSQYGFENYHFRLFSSMMPSLQIKYYLELLQIQTQKIRANLREQILYAKDALFFIIF